MRHGHVWNSAKQLKVAVTLSQQTLPHCSLIPRFGALTNCPLQRVNYLPNLSLTSLLTMLSQASACRCK